VDGRTKKPVLVEAPFPVAARVFNRISKKLTVRGSDREWYVHDPLRGTHGPFATEQGAFDAAAARAEAIGGGTAVVYQGRTAALWYEWTPGTPKPDFFSTSE